MSRLWRRRTVAPLALGIGVLGTVQVRRMVRKEEIEQPNPLSPQTVNLILKLPARALSRLWGAVNEVELPTWARQPLLGLYSRAFDCNLEEAEEPDLSKYSCLQEFFGRYLKRGARPISPAVVNSPADCRVLSYGVIDRDGVVDQVKGISYRVDKLLGEELPEPQPGNRLYHCILYLAPGDYHHFHSPVAWNPDLVRHIPGGLLSVAPVAARAIRGLFALNERVVVRGDWDHGAFYYCAVGAYNVGSIHVLPNKDVVTNCINTPANSPHQDYPSTVSRLQKGEEVGAFRLGSTVVLVFEAPEGMEFGVQEGQRLRVGDALFASTD